MYMSSPKQPQGFTLIELMVTIAVLAILASIAVPNLRSFLVNADLRGSINTLQSDAMNARQEAIRLQRTVVIRPKTGVDWKTGWQMTIENPPTGVPALKSSRDELPESLTIGFDNTGAVIRYDSAGFSRDASGGFLAGCIRFDAAYTGRASGIVFDAAGRPRVWKGLSSASSC